MHERDPRSRFEDEGIPDLQDGTPQQQWANDPQERSLPGDEPSGVDEHGTTAQEQRTGESLDSRLAREQPEPGPGREEAPHRLVAPDRGTGADNEKDEIADDVGPDAGGYGPEERAIHIEPE